MRTCQQKITHLFVEFGKICGTPNQTGEIGVNKNAQIVQETKIGHASNSTTQTCYEKQCTFCTNTPHMSKTHSVEGAPTGAYLGSTL